MNREQAFIDAQIMYADECKKLQQQITELQKQLEEEEKELREIKVENYTIKSYRDFLNNKCKNLIKENKKLKQQLNAQPAEIVEKIKKLCCIEDKCKDGSFVLGLNEKDLDDILKEYQK